MSAQARFEIVRTDAGHHARFVAANNRIVWTSETYKRVKGAENAVEVICGTQIASFYGNPEIAWRGNRRQPTEVRYLDLRPTQRGEAGGEG